MAARYALKRELVPPTHKNTPTVRGGKAQEKDVLQCHALHDSALAKYPFWAQFEAQGWIRFLTSKHPTYPKLVKYFNKHVQFGEDYMFIDCGDNRFLYDVDNFTLDFGMRSDGFSDYHMNTWPIDMQGLEFGDLVYTLNRRDLFPEEHSGGFGAYKDFLSNEDYVMVKLLRDVVLHTTNSSKDLSRLETMVLYRLKCNLPINLPQLLISHIHSALNRGNVNYYPLGGLVSFIMLQWAILVSPSNVVGVPPHVIGRATISKMGFELSHGALVPKATNKKRQRPPSPLEAGPSTAELSDDALALVYMDPSDGAGAHRPTGQAESSTPRRSVEERLSALEAKIDANQKQNQSCYSGLLSLLKCIGRKQGLSDVEMDAAAAHHQ